MEQVFELRESKSPIRVSPCLYKFVRASSLFDRPARDNTCVLDMAPSPPTGREVLILVTLLISLLFLSNSSAPSSPLFSHPSFDAILNTSHVAPWQPTTVPETTVATHAPGRLFFLSYVSNKLTPHRMDYFRSTIHFQRGCVHSH